MIVGFSAYRSLDKTSLGRGAKAQERALQHFPWLNRVCQRVADTAVDFWGHGELADCIHYGEDGSLLGLIGSPSGGRNQVSSRKPVSGALSSQDFVTSCDGRFVLLKISADGKTWTMWNDWAGSIPVFHAQVGKGWIASTLEPVVVAAAGFTPNDFFPPGMVSLLINGHYLGDWTLFRGMKVVPADSMAEWSGSLFRWKRMGTVAASDARWDKGWDELSKEMHELTHEAVADVLRTGSHWILPLSGGIDSRLIATIGAEIGTAFSAYTYGHPDWGETVYARQVARRLGIPWQRVPIPPDYLVRYTRLWFEWFGSSQHCHGMYQMPFLESLNGAPQGRILQGYLGDPLAGNHVKALLSTHRDRDGARPVMSGGVGWPVESLANLLQPSIVQEGFAALEAKMSEELQEPPGALFQRLMLLDFWNRQRLGISYHPMMYDYYRGVATPFFNRRYANFCLSLPLLALEDRRLQKEMICRFYPRIATIGGMFGPPLRLSRGYLLKRALAEMLPRVARRGPLQEFASTGNRMQVDALRAYGEGCLWPLDDVSVRRSLYEWFRKDALEMTYHRAAAGDETAYDRLRPIQAIAWHFTNKEG